MFSNACITFCNTFIEMSGIDLIFKYLQNEALIKYNSNFNILHFNDEIKKEFVEFRSFKFTNKHVYLYNCNPDYQNNASPREIVFSLSVLDELIPDNQFYNLIYKLRHNRFWVDYFSSTNLQSNNILEF